MIWASKILSFLLLALWLPATSHCALERAGVIETDDCCTTESHSSIPSEHSCADGCATVEGGAYKLPAPQKSMVSPLLVVCLWAESAAQIDATIASIPSQSLVDELIASWQFDHRAALPVRAPSFAS